jgi:predicted amidohydrolase
MREASAVTGDVLAALTENPAAALGLQNKDRLRVGGDADLLLLDAKTGDLNGTMCGGRWLGGARVEEWGFHSNG